MCGIIAILRRRTRRQPPPPDEVRRALEAALAAMPGIDDRDLPGKLDEVSTHLEQVNRLLWGPAGIRTLLADQSLVSSVQESLVGLGRRLDEIESALDAREAGSSEDSLEHQNAALLRLKDAHWAVSRDRLRAAAAVGDLAGTATGPAAIDAFASIHSALSALDRLEVRGRDSAGLQLLITNHGLDLSSPEVSALLDLRRDDPLFTSGSARTPSGQLSLVYKAAAEIGELGDNVRVLRQAIKEDDLLRLALAADSAEVTVLGHTRWASVGIISEANAHPLNQEEVGRSDGSYVVAALNGDVDNHADLVTAHNLQVAESITTDAKVIPVLVSRNIDAGLEPCEAFRRTVNEFEGSVAIAAAVGSAPDKLLLALRGSGQALYVGTAEDLFIVASEPYGVIEETQTYLRLDGETPGNPANPAASRGQILELCREQAGSPVAIRRLAYDGTAMPVQESELHRAAITTRDVDRGAFPHFLLKEITEAPRTMHKTLRGRLAETNGRLRAALGKQVISDALRSDLSVGRIRHIVVIGQGTAAVAGKGVAAAIAEALASAAILVQGMPATELSGFHMRNDMSDLLVVAISQSGTTTDTNRTVDLIRGRGAKVIAIVNRRGSDLVDKADGVLYTSDGRDVEMSVASTKAFYAQIAAGWLLAHALAECLGVTNDEAQDKLLRALRGLPEVLEKVLGLRERIAAAARRYAPPRRYWALVGNGLNRIAAEEVRIKLSELCYKSIACDATEDKKHIDLSSEPLILVCAAGLMGSTAADVAKEIAIYRAHKAAPIVIASEGEEGYGAAVEVIPVPRVHPSLAFILSTMVGHLFGYEAALAINALANPLREARADIEAAISTDSGIRIDPLLTPKLAARAAAFRKDLTAGLHDGHLEASTAARLSTLFGYATGMIPLDSYQVEFGRMGTPGQVLEDLVEALTLGIEELTRPVDAIKHQAKTVTVGVSRADETLLTVPLVRATIDAGASRERISYRDLRALAELDPAVEEVVGFTRYEISGDPTLNGASIRVTDRRGISLKLRSRTAKNDALRGTKHRVAVERRMMVAKGLSDGRSVILIPELEQGRVRGITLLHVVFVDKLSAAALRGVLGGYRNRYSALVDAVTETEPSFREELLETIPVVELLTEPIHVLAVLWR